MLRRLMKLLVVPLLFIVLLALGTVPATPTSAQTDERCFPETGYCISGQIRAYWEANGGLPVFGYPITDVYVDTVEGWTGPLQWFERDRLEDHSAEGVGVLAGRLGARLLELRGTPWESYPQVTSAESGCRFFAETGHSMCEPFLSYWSNNGGLERFGFPVTEPFVETLGDWTGRVQYFERRRMEHHTENAGTPFEVQLGLLGRSVYNFTPPPPTINCTSEVIPELQNVYNRSEINYFRVDMGCPGEVYSDIPAAIQAFQNGQMIWTQLTEEDQRIWAYLTWGTYYVFPDTFQEGVDPEEPAVSPPPGLYKPRRGFGKVWINNPILQDEYSGLGWAIEQLERPATATVQLFDNGGAMVWLQDTENVLVFGPESWQAALLPRTQ